MPDQTERAGPVSQAERAQARRQQADVEKIMRIGMVAGFRVAMKTRASVIAAYRSGSSIPTALTKGLDELHGLLVQAMVLSELTAMRRVVSDLAEKHPAKADLVLAQSPVYTQAIRKLLKRQTLTEKQLEQIEKKADANVVRVLKDASKAAQVALLQEVRDITQEGLHVREGMKRLTARWEKLGLTRRNSFQIEAVFRTQTQLAYSAGQRAVLSDPDIDEILWGYKYVTVGDDRVRDSHAGLDGVTLPKEDAFWETTYPPCGWACRCEAIAIFTERKLVHPVAGAGPDEGFDFDPATVLNPKTPPPVPSLA